jgi:hypothetical protein
LKKFQKNERPIGETILYAVTEWGDGVGILERFLTTYINDTD